MFVTKKQHNTEIGKLRGQIDEMRAIIIEFVGADQYMELVKKTNEPLADLMDDDTPDTSAGNFLDDEPKADTITAPIDETKKLPSRAEYDERVKSAIEKFRAGKNVSTVMVELHIAKKTARRYLKIALAKRKVKKADFDNLNV